MTLSGWQRLFVVLAVLWLVCVAGLGAMLWPTRAEIQRRWTTELLQDVIDTDPTVRQRSTYALRTAYGDMTDVELADAVRAKYGISEADTEWTVVGMQTADRLAETDARFRTEVAGLTRARMESVGAMATVWLVPLVVVYCLGWAVGWVYRGFAHRGEKR